MRPHPLAAAGFLGLSFSLCAALAGAAGLPGRAGGLDWPAAARFLLLFAFLLPAAAALHLRVAALLERPAAPETQASRLAGLYAAGGLLGALGQLFGASRPSLAVTLAGVLLLAAGGLVQAQLARQVLPRRGASVVDVARDPVTKGDDASFQHIRLAHLFLPAGLFLVAASHLPGLGAPWVERLGLSGLHVLLVGYGALSLYGLGHLVVPRLSGVPAIAAGAIKGELHSTLSALVLLVLGFLLDGITIGAADGGWDVPARGFRIAGGGFAFLGAFTYMGVLGANIMRRKSVTQRVTPEFVYVPWTFAGVFWLVAGILLGLFLNAVPDAWLGHLPALRSAHRDAVLVGAFAQLWIGWSLRLAPAQAGRAPPTFHRTRWAFYGLNLGLALLVGGALADSGPWRAAGSALLLAAVAASFMTLWRDDGPRTPA